MGAVNRLGRKASRITSQEQIFRSGAQSWGKFLKGQRAPYIGGENRFSYTCRSMCDSRGERMGQSNKQFSLSPPRRPHNTSKASVPDWQSQKPKKSPERHSCLRIRKKIKVTQHSQFKGFLLFVLFQIIALTQWNKPVIGVIHQPVSGTARHCCSAGPGFQEWKSSGNFQSARQFCFCNWIYADALSAH